ncbi:hypothetical protein KFZ58_03935 [Virgibacillus sp. NKC19-16]|uniref:CD3337/EF1877 family mobilome membrane protein n=1 Tax=Virgibacillus salidurans TaxID=2831673 RepID=UPI001F370C43|nr:hypothetical protein [Virgibacillus sp. NKC19-16]UJL47093.1 hypothetical protein KFZ58_03935 [Virgibacillus sp. NKC19-16]
MKWVKRSLLWLMVFILFLIPASGVVFAEYGGHEENMSEPQVEMQGGIELESTRFPIDRYTVNNEAEDDMIKGAFMGFSNAIFTFTGNVVVGVDKALEELFTLEPIDRFSGHINLISQSIYNTLQDYFGQMLFVFAVSYMIYLAVAKGTFQEAFRRSVLFLMVLLFGGYWMLNAGYFVSTFNNLSVEVQGYLLEAGNGLITMVDDDGVYEQTDAIDVENPVSGTIGMMRNVYFDLSFKRPYLIINYGETDEQAINDADEYSPEDLPGGESYNRVDRLLAYERTEDGLSQKQDYIQSFELSDYNNHSMAEGQVWTQLGQVLIAFLAAVFLAIPFLGLGILNFLLQLVALALAFFLPFALIVSYIPQFAYSGFKVFLKLLTTFVVKAMLALVIVFVFALTYVVDVMIPPESFAMYLVNMVTLITLFLLMIKKRDAIVKLVTAGRVQSMDGQLMNNVQQRMVSPAMDKTAKAVSHFHPGAGKAIQNVNRMQQAATLSESASSSTNQSDLRKERTPQHSGSETSPSENQPSEKPSSNRRERTSQHDQVSGVPSEGDQQGSSSSSNHERPSQSVVDLSDRKQRKTQAEENTTKPKDKYSSDFKEKPPIEGKSYHSSGEDKRRQSQKEQSNQSKKGNRSKVRRSGVSRQPEGVKRKKQVSSAAVKREKNASNKAYDGKDH